jgi:hypothetical protein
MSQDVGVLDKNPASTPVPNNATQVSVGLPSKEVAPIRTVESPLEQSGAEISPSISNELKEIGISTEKKPSLPPHLTYAGPHIEVPISSSGKVVLPDPPMTEKEAKLEIKTGKKDDSKYSLAKEVIKYFKELMLGKNIS